MKIERFHFDTVTSTNDFAKELLQKADCVVVTANYQTKGRGRNNNYWLGNYSENVYFSFALKHNSLKRIDEVSHFQALAGLAVLFSLKELCKSDIFKLKYPNDIYVKCFDGVFRKISGILVEHQFLGEFCSSTILGIGINVNQTNFEGELAERATSLKLLGFEFTTEEVIAKLISEIEDLFQLFPHKIFELWQKALNIIGKEIELINQGIKCIADRFDDFGHLVAKIPQSGNEIIVTNGDTIRYGLER